MNHVSKQCSKCLKIKLIDCFHKNKKSKDGHYSICKSCKMDYVEQNRDRINKNNRKYKEANRDRINKNNLEYCKNNYDRLKPHRAEYAHTYRHQECITDIYLDRLSHLRAYMEDGFLKVPCYKCGNHFTPTNGMVSAYLIAFETGKSSNNFYCSDVCKNSCTVFGSHPNKSSKSTTETDLARKCQTSHLKQLQCDDVGHNYCEKCGDIIDVELHHTLPISRYGNESISSAGHILLCYHCHTLVDC